MKPIATAILLFLIVSCGMAQKPGEIVEQKNIDITGIKILKALSENRNIARICKDTVMVKNNPYHIVYFIDTSIVQGIYDHFFVNDFCIITDEKDLPIDNRTQVFYVIYFRHGNFSADISLITRDRNKITSVDCELKSDSSGNWNVHHIRIKKRKAPRIIK